MASCSGLQAWAQQGCLVELPADLRQHVAVCSACSKSLASITRVRELVGKIPVHRVSTRQLDSIEVLLRAETQYMRLGVTPTSKGRKWRIGAAVALLVGTASVAAALVLQQSAPPPPDTRVQQTLPAVIVAWSPGAQGQSFEQVSDYHYVLREGEGEFNVRKLNDERTLRVVAADSTLLTKNAHFRARVANGRLEQVEVVDGQVTVQRNHVAIVTLGPGQLLAPTATVAPSNVVVSTVPSAPTRIVPPERKAARSTRPLPDDTAFAAAFDQLSAGHASAAALAFDALLSRSELDDSRRSDVVYWSSQAHARAGNRTLAEMRGRTYLNRYPTGLHAGNTALLLGDYARERGQVSLARSYYERALTSGHPTTVTRAKRLLASLPSR